MCIALPIKDRSMLMPVIWWCSRVCVPLQLHSTWPCAQVCAQMPCLKMTHCFYVRSSVTEIFVLQTDDMFEIKADLPGVAKSLINVDVDGDALTLSVRMPSSDDTKASDTPDATAGSTPVTTNTAADTPSATASSAPEATGAAGVSAPEDTSAKAAETKAAAGGKNRKVHRHERGARFAERTLRMPDSADMSKVSAELELGVLTVSVPKKEEAVTQRRQVPVA